MTDYKQRNPVLSKWPLSLWRNVRHPLLFVCPGHGAISEIDAPDGTTTFLSFCTTNISEDAVCIRYLVEAPQDSILRQAFESGQVTMEDFWHHRGWVIRAEYGIYSDTVRSLEYIHPSMMEIGATSYFERFEKKSPYQYLLESCELFVTYFREQGEDYRKFPPIIAERHRQLTRSKKRAA